MQRKLNWHRWFVFEWGKPTRQKPHQVILRSPLSRIHYYHNNRLQVKESQYLIPTYSWTFTTIPNWTCSVVTISPFQCTAPSTWLTNRCVDPNMRLKHQLEKDVGCKVLQFITRWRSRSSDHNLHEQNFALHLRNLWRPLKQSLYMFRVVRKENPNIYSRDRKSVV